MHWILPADCKLLSQILFEVDGTNVFREGLDVIAQLLLGEPGTLVRLLILRGTRIFIEVNLQRETHARTVRCTCAASEGENYL